MTTVIGLYGASGVGKSTTAAALFAEMKMRGYHVEQVSEYIKAWAWEGRVPNKFDQLYIFGKQSRAESKLYGKVDYIVTDSPLWLSGFYEARYVGREIIAPAITNYLQYIQEHGVKHINFWLKRNKPYDPRGRYESEESSIANHELLRDYLDSKNVSLIDITVPDRQRIDFILSHLPPLSSQNSSETFVSVR